MEKSKWEKPMLMVLMGGNPEEMVLSTCKGGVNPPGPDQSHNICWVITMECGACDGVAVS